MNNRQTSLWARVAFFLVALAPIAVGFALASIAAITPKSSNDPYDGDTSVTTEIDAPENDQIDASPETGWVYVGKIPYGMGDIAKICDGTNLLYANGAGMTDNNNLAVSRDDPQCGGSGANSNPQHSRPALDVKYRCQELVIFIFGIII